MANEGYLGSYKLTGERASTSDHPVIIHALPLATSVTTELAPGTLLKRADTDSKVAYAPWLSTDTTDHPVAVVDDVCTSEAGSVIAVVHGCVKTRMLKSGDAIAPTDIQLANLSQIGIFAV